jgi:hypothetical protein
MFVMTWSNRRKLFILTGIFLFLAVLVALPVFLVTYQAPSCFDKKQNQSEGGVDCGGQCTLLCETTIAKPKVLWVRSFRVSKGIYNAVVYVENPNLDSGASVAPYTIYLRDANSQIVERKGTTFITPGKTFAIFETGIKTGERVPLKTEFDFAEGIAWTKNIQREPVLTFENMELTSEDKHPRLTAGIKNGSLLSVNNIEVVAVMYDAGDNAIASSRTTVDSVGPESSEQIVFTWPEPFSSIAVRQELLYRLITH